MLGIVWRHMSTYYIYLLVSNPPTIFSRAGKLYIIRCTIYDDNIHFLYGDIESRAEYAVWYLRRLLRLLSKLNNAACTNRT
jgi:hypothetical protein